MTEIFVQVMIPLMSISAASCAQLNYLQKWKARKFAPIIGMSSQPFWFYTGFTHDQYGIVVVSFFFLGMWYWGFHEQWIKPRAKRKIDEQDHQSVSSES